MTPEDLAKLVADRIAETNERLAALNAARSSGAATTAEWLEATRLELKNSYIQLAELGKGGRDLMTAQDWGRVGGDLGDQYKYLQEFAGGIDANGYEDAYVENRLSLYGEATKEAYWDSAMSNIGEGDPNLPVLENTPGDGGTQCMTRCGCGVHDNGDGSVHWVVDEGKENCDDCLALAQGGPYRVS